jgi:YebC/PmpR family DNA-binding regulatory protein
MAGHSQFKNIMHRKGRQDAKRAREFTRLIREVQVAARSGLPDPAANPRLRAALQAARAANVPKDNIERAIRRGSGSEDEAYEDVRYEGYGPGGAAVMVDCMTDNRNRTVSDVRHAFNKHGGNLGTDGSVAFLFTHAGVITFAPGTDEDRVMELALEAGAEDIVTNEDGSIEVLTTPDTYIEVRDTLVSGGLEPADAEVTMRPSTTVSLAGDDAVRMVKLLERLEDLDDVQRVYHNAEIAEEAYAQA